MVFFTGRAQGDLRSAPGDGTASDVVDRRQRALVDAPWHSVRQVHGTTVVHVGDDWSADDPVDGDGLVTRRRGLALAIKVADCAPVALASPEGVIGAVHAGWRGLVGGVIERTAAAMRGLGAGRIEAAVGPCIHAECYEFSAADLDAVAGRLGDSVRGVTAKGTPALDVPAAVDAALHRAGVDTAWRVDSCTSCEAGRWFSHRARQEAERQAVVVWMP